jgi:hypothetical protein
MEDLGRRMLSGKWKMENRQASKTLKIEANNFLEGN